MAAIYTGCRFGEIKQLRWRDVQLDSQTIRVENTKTETNSTDQFRTITIHSELLKVLGRPKKPTSLVFPEISQRFNEWARKHLMRACKSLNIQYKRFHGLRHTTATYLLAAGVSLRDVMQLMGWTRIDTAQRYIHLANAAAEQMSKLPY